MPIPEFPYIVWGIITENGSPIALKTVTVENLTLGGSDTRITDADGFYLYDDLAQLPNSYNIGNTIRISVTETYDTFIVASEPEEKEINLSYITLTILNYERASMRGCHRGIMVGVG